MDGQPMATAPSGTPIEAHDPDQGWAIVVDDGPRWRMLADMHRAFEPVEWRAADPAAVALLLKRHPWAQSSYETFCAHRNGVTSAS